MSRLCFAVAVGLLGCGHDVSHSDMRGAGDQGSASSSFVGTWVAGASQSTDQCPSAPALTQDHSGGTETITAGTEPDVIVVSGMIWNQFSCSFEFTVSGDTATLNPSQPSCDLHQGMVCDAGALDQQLMPMTDTLVLVDANTLHETYFYNYLHTECGDVTCTESGQDTFTRQ